MNTAYKDANYKALNFGIIENGTPISEILQSQIEQKVNSNSNSTLFKENDYIAFLSDKFRTIMPESDIVDCSYMNQVLGNYNEAIRILEKSLEESIARDGNNHKTVGTTYLHIAEIHSLEKKFEEAAEYFEKALEVFKNIPKVDEPLLARLNNEYGKMLLDQGRYNDALKYFEKATIALHQIKGEGNLLLHYDVEDNYGKIRVILKNLENAARLRERGNTERRIDRHKNPLTESDIQKLSAVLLTGTLIISLLIISTIYILIYRPLKRIIGKKMSGS